MSSSRRGFLRGAAAVLVGAPIALAHRSEDEVVVDAISAKTGRMTVEELHAAMDFPPVQTAEDADRIGRIMAQAYADAVQEVSRG